MSEKPDESECAKWLKALAEPLRLKIVQELQHGPTTVTSLTESLGAEMVTTSHHLQVLLHAGIVNMKKKGRFSEYCLNPEFLKKQSKKNTVLDFGCCRFELAQIDT